MIACNFCGQSEADGVRIVAGPAEYICEECVNACCIVLGSQMKWRASEGSAVDAWEAARPEDREGAIFALMDKHRQYRAIRAKWRSLGLEAIATDCSMIIDAVGAAIDILQDLSPEGASK